jgi:hypothetical protein
LDSETDAVRRNLELGLRFAQMKELTPGGWIRRLKRLDFSARVITRYIKAAKALVEPDGTIPQLVRRLPADPHKLESLAALPRVELEALVGKHDCRQLDRGEVILLVREAQGKKPAVSTTSSTPEEAIRRSWAKALEGVLGKLKKIQGKDEQERLVRFLEATLEDVKLSLRDAEQAEEGHDEDAEEDVEEGMEAGEQDAGEQKVAGGATEPTEGDQEVEPEEEEAARPPKPATGRLTSRPRGKP